MEALLATAFGRYVKVQRGEHDQLADAASSVFKNLSEGTSLETPLLILILCTFIISVPRREVIPAERSSLCIHIRETFIGGVQLENITELYVLCCMYNILQQIFLF